MRILVIFSLICVAVFATSASYASSDAQGQAGATHPNILYLLTDDMRFDDIQYMPKTQALLRDQGADFGKFYVTTPLCCPSRASGLTGKYAHNTGVRSNKSGFHKFNANGNEADSIAPILHDQGYRTGLFGKYLNAYQKASYVPPGWDEWAARVDDQGQGGEFYNFTLSENGKPKRYHDSPEDYQTDVLSDKADEFIRTTQNQPFFAYVTPAAPHTPAQPAPRHKGVYGGNKRAETLLAVDDLVERLVNTLKENGQLDNTYIFFSSDNGWMEGEHGIDRGKIVAYEESARVPLLVKGPGVSTTKVDKLGSNIDLAPTFAEIGGTTTPYADGRSLMPLLRGTTLDSWRNRILIENSYDKRGPYGAVRTDRYKLIQGGGKKDMLFDLDADPHENTNTIDTADPALVQQLRASIEALKECSQQSCRDIEDTQ